MVPPAAVARRIADGHQAVQAILVHRSGRHLRGEPLAARLALPPVLFRIVLDPGVDEGIGVFALVVKVRHPDVVVQPGRLEGDLLRIQTQRAGDLLITVVPVTEPHHLDACLPADKSSAIKHRVARLDEPGTGAQAFHVPGDAQHQLDVGRHRIRRAAAPIVVAEGVRRLPLSAHHVLVRPGGGIHHKVRVAERLLPVQRLREGQVRAEILAEACGQVVDGVQPPLMDVHESDVAARQAFRQADVLDESE